MNTHRKGQGGTKRTRSRNGHIYKGPLPFPTSPDTGPPTATRQEGTYER